MSNKIVMKAGEATIFSEGKDVTAAMPEIVIGAVDGPVGQAFANLMAQNKGHSAMFAVRDINQMVRPACMPDFGTWHVPVGNESVSAR